MVVISEMPSSSSSPSTLVHRYDVFLSFRGFDTRYNFTDHLYNTLKNANITTFLDDEEIETGLPLKPELETAIKASRSSIIVLSKNYASSTWCLDELVLILEQVRNPNYFLIPIFYHVEPTDVRKQQNSFGEAMAKHKQRMETETNAEKRSQWAQKLELWKKALTQVADLKGEYIGKHRKEGDFIEEIVTNIHRRLGVLLSSPQPLIIGMDYHIRSITTWLKDGTSQTADILTISGMGGIGKTTLAKYIFTLYGHEFQRSSFIEGISRTCANKYNGLLDLQMQICGDISKPSSIQVRGDVSVYTSKIENLLARTKVFLVLDDVDSLDQLDALLGNKGFHPGSKIVITTKNKSLTERCELFNQIVQPKHTKHLLQGLNKYESLKFLSLSAFKRDSPKEGYKEVSDTLVKYCGGHPLALKVLGSSLCNKDVAIWKDCIERLKEEPDSTVEKVLQMSFDTLPSKDDKELFKHIACFFVGENRESTETILKACGIHTVVGIENLIDRCLLWISENDNKLMMHQLIQEMGRDVVRQESIDIPEERSRLWCHEVSFKVLKRKTGTRKIKGLVLDMRMLEKDKLYELETEALSKMDNLMLLQLNYVHPLKGSYKDFPEELRWLCMHGFPLEYIPPDLQLENLVILDMSYSKLVSFDMSYGNTQQSRMRQMLNGLGSIYEHLYSRFGLLEDRQKLTESRSKDEPSFRSLKILNLSYCAQLRKLGGFYEFPALETLILSNCISLIEVCESIQQCDRLEHIDLSYCNEAGKLVKTIRKVKNVKILNLDGCNLSQLSIEMISDLELPEIVKANNIVKNSQTSSSTIVETIPRGFRSLVISLPSSLVCLSLEENHLCNESFPMDMSSLFMLKELCLDGNDIVSMPSCVRTLPRLEILSIENCPRLMTIEHPPRTLKLLAFHVDYKVGKVVFDKDMSPIELYVTGSVGPFIEGVFKEEDMGDVKEEVLHSLGWTNLDTTKLESKVKMLYELGIFSTCYRGKEMPNWISERREGSSISFTIPSSPNNLRGLNICFVVRLAIRESNDFCVKRNISNITKNLTWIYPFGSESDPTVEDAVYLSHWMFGKNEMEDGDQITISILNVHDDDTAYIISECGVSFVYDENEDGKKKMKEEEDVLGYYKSWKHIIGGDLSPFETTTPGEYRLDISKLIHLEGANSGLEAILGVNPDVGKVVFDQGMSPIKLSILGGEVVLIEGLFKEKDMADVEEELLHSLGWTNIDFTKKQPVNTRYQYKVKMVYEFGIFSTSYDGKEMPNWISERRKGSSISVTIPSSPYSLRGLNFCFVYKTTEYQTVVRKKIRMSNITKNRTWIYTCDVEFHPTRERATCLSHWMLGKNEMEDGDQINISFIEEADGNIRECGVSLVYDEDGKMKMIKMEEEEGEEDVLSYYKSWNHIIGGDLSPFQTTTPGEYDISRKYFLGYNGGPNYLDDDRSFRAFPKGYLN